jgi:hypothetical protein
VNRRRLIGLVCLLVAATAASAGPASGPACPSVALQLDPRLTATEVDRAWATGEDRSETPAVLELRGCKGELFDRMVLDAPLARLDRTPLRGPAVPTYLVTVDLTAPAGSYSGPLTLAVEVLRRRLHRAEASAGGGAREPIRLAATGKAAWKKTFHAGNDELLAVSCQPRDGGFVVTYRRFQPGRTGWRLRQRSETGFWESDQEFPPPERFR